MGTATCSVQLRNDAADAAPDLKRTEKPAEINTAEKSMAQSVRGARATAKRGDLFTPATQAMFRRMLRAPLNKGGGEGADNKAIIKDDAPGPKEVPFKVNADYPKEAPLSTVPPDVLLTLAAAARRRAVPVRRQAPAPVRCQGEPDYRLHVERDSVVFFEDDLCGHTNHSWPPSH